MLGPPIESDMLLEGPTLAPPAVVGGPPAARVSGRLANGRRHHQPARTANALIVRSGSTVDCHWLSIRRNKNTTTDCIQAVREPVALLILDGAARRRPCALERICATIALVDTLLGDHVFNVPITEATFDVRERGEQYWWLRSGWRRFRGRGDGGAQSIGNLARSCAEPYAFERQQRQQ